MTEYKSEWASKLYSMRLQSLSEVFMVDKPVIAMVHLPPLPGSPGFEGYSFEDVVEKAIEEAGILADNGVDGLIVENMWSLPYYAGSRVPLTDVVCVAVAAREVVKTVDIPVGVNLIHNGGVSTLTAAMAAGAEFIRVCLFTGGALWDVGGFDTGVAADLLRARKYLGCHGIRIFADVRKKHSVMFPGVDLEIHARWCDFYLADALIVTGSMTGVPPSIEDIYTVKRAAPERPVIVGSGVDHSNIDEFLRVADGVIVGTSLKYEGLTQNPVDPKRVKILVEKAREAREKQ